MGTCYPGSGNESDVLPTTYIHSPKSACYPDPHFLPESNMLREAASDRSYPGALDGSSLASYHCSENPSAEVRNELVLLPQTGDLVDNSHMSPRTQLGTLDGAWDSQSQGLSLRLGSEPVLPCQYINSGFASILSTYGPTFEVNGCILESCKSAENSQGKPWKSADYLPFEQAYANGTQSVISFREMLANESSGLAMTISNSKYLRAAQQLLDEIVNVWEALKHSKLDKKSIDDFSTDEVKETDETSSSSFMPNSLSGISSDLNVSNSNSSCKLSSTEQQDLQSKKTRLLFLLDEVDRIYRHYYHQMEVLVSSLEVVAGCGAAKSYTALALQTISQHFRCLRDTIVGQIRATQKNLGEQDTSPSGQGGVISRLRFVDQKLKQQRVLQHLGMTQQVWRPQRGLPENSVSILRAWLFEHFLNPYPNDSEKAMLARQTGLNRNQIANWFINARVRLWKPMVEDMYKEEFGDPEMNCKSSPEKTYEAGRDTPWTFEMTEGPQESLGSRAAPGGPPRQEYDAHDLDPDLIHGENLNGSIAEGGFQNGAFGD